MVDAWYTLLDRWGTMSFAQVLAPAIGMAENGFPVDDRLAGAISGSKKLRKYPSSARVYYSAGTEWKGGAVATFPDLARTLRKLVEAERENAAKGRHEALRAARDRFYRGDIAREMARFSEENGGLFRYNDFASYTAKIEEPVATEYRGYRVLSVVARLRSGVSLATAQAETGRIGDRLTRDYPDANQGQTTAVISLQHGAIRSEASAASWSCLSRSSFAA